VLDPTGKSLGVVAFDSDDDGFTDLAVANDTQPNFLYHNRGDGTFEEIGRTAGIAFSEEGKARGAMGIDAADYDGSGRESLVIGNFSNEMLALYHNEGRGLFIDDAAAAGIGQPSLLTLAFGCFFFDYDLDGRLDIFVANGHVENEIQAVQPSVTYAEPPHLFRGGADSRFEETTAKVGSDLAVPRVARGAAAADFDGDGDLDIAVDDQRRAGGAVPQRRRQRQRLRAPQARRRRRQVEPRCHRRARHPDVRRPRAGPHGPLGGVVRLAERDGADLRPGPGPGRRGQRRGALAGRHDLPFPGSRRGPHAHSAAG
jgi:hypothetical protein